ncbi:hypothetical protein DFH07DRAFT_952428 [Mycena maculata]|uniref:Uncharacterized protein n=1 Tax=Mycena maculata TaxID=230809 RepID=A0AAD7K093_9AGAR|nr:hypothetical protein DFH07DRAFT_952428 [Mycena maculata]
MALYGQDIDKHLFFFSLAILHAYHRHLTTNAGISSLLVFMGTGQGSSTAEYLTRIDTEPNKFLFPSLDACVAEFEFREHQDKLAAPEQKIKFFNPAIYGQANTWYTLHPALLTEHGKYVFLDIREKFSPFWADELHRSYRALLGPLAGQDPAECKPQISW